MRILLDTGPLVAMLNKRDAYHAWSIDQAATLAPPFFTCEAVLAEAHHLLGGITQGNHRLIELLETGRVELTPTVARHLDRIGQLMRRYSSVPMAFADACLVCMAAQKESTIFTLDSDFRIYRKKQKDALRLLIP